MKFLNSFKKDDLSHTPVNENLPIWGICLTLRGVIANFP